ncbi:Precorrin-6Y C(5,15)-methyltransferase [decarboxylating] [Pontivivens insulae]|uniref:Precorrin-6Y C(5,15)-methyltransferase [decarboxylating] n=2 Tax=Pontivivens insulae TaxID=1639689 RepID=A0A2R8AD66_9RHOB|nr:Precorrin-6Y C(5,15)-methyltransferase [decarboxylating] [Pontivivens insulae]
MAPPRHLELIGPTEAEQITWPVPYADGIARLLTLRGRPVVVLASGDPFWFGAGTSITRHLSREEWEALPAPSTFALAAARMGWPLESTRCFGLHAAPFGRLRPHLGENVRALVLLRDGDAVSALADFLMETGHGQSGLTVLEALGGPRERITQITPQEVRAATFSHPVAVAIDAQGAGLPQVSGLPDELFDHDGQITKRPVRALTLSTLAPRAGESLWDIGGGSGSIAIEWLLSHPATSATIIEQSEDRAARIKTNADALGADRLKIVTGTAPDALDDLAPPDAVFVGGGVSEAMLQKLSTLPAGTRLVANAVTLEAEALLSVWHAKLGGELMRIEVSQAKPLGRKHGWKASYPIVQWSTVL